MKKNSTKNIIIILMVVILTPRAYGQVYYWPLIEGFKYVRGTYGEYRPSHLHEGIDISEESINSVWCTYDAYKYLQGYYDQTWKYIVLVQHYTISGNYEDTIEVDEGSRYLHMYNIQNLDEETIYVFDTLISLNTSFLNSHLHFEFRSPAPLTSSIKNSSNPFSLGGDIYPLNPADVDTPILKHLYVDGDEQHQGNAEIENWNFLNYDFSGYYDDSTASPFICCDLPDESPHNDLDDPHILVSGSGKVRFIVEAQDRINEDEYPKGSPWFLQLHWDEYIDIDFVDDTVSYCASFDWLNREANEQLSEEDIYHVNSPCSSRIKTAPQETTFFYYRLYPIDVNNDGFPSCLVDKDLFETEELDEGCHQIRVIAKDYSSNKKTADLHLYIRKSDYVDFCRGFQE